MVIGQGHRGLLVVPQARTVGQADQWAASLSTEQPPNVGPSSKEHTYFKKRPKSWMFSA